MLAAVVISLLLPFVKITVFSSPAPDEQAVYQAIRTITTDDRWFENETVAVTVKPSLLTAENIAAVSYMLVSLFAFLIFCMAVLKFVKLYKNHRRWTIQNGQTVRCRHEKIVTFRLPETEENQNKSTISVANATMKVLYLGLDNPLMVSGGGIPANKLILTTNNSAVRRINGQWVARPATTGEAVITITDQSASKKCSFFLQLNLCRLRS